MPESLSTLLLSRKLGWLMLSGRSSGSFRLSVVFPFRDGGTVTFTFSASDNLFIGTYGCGYSFGFFVYRQTGYRIPYTRKRYKSTAFILLKEIKRVSFVPQLVCRKSSIFG
jgi:hypothetical protein